MKLKGKIAVWFYLVIIFIVWMEVYTLVTTYDENIISSLLNLVVSILIDVLFLSIVMNNYVEFKDEYLLITFGFIKRTIPYEDIISVTETNNPLSSLAASLDRIEIKCKTHHTVMVSICDKDKFFKEIKNKNTDIVVVNK